MNIFVLDRSPIKAAQMLCDAHVVKMVVDGFYRDYDNSKYVTSRKVKVQ